MEEYTKHEEINEAFSIDRTIINEHDDDFIIIRCVGEDNMNEMIEHIKKFESN